VKLKVEVRAFTDINEEQFENIFREIRSTSFIEEKNVCNSPVTIVTLQLKKNVCNSPVTVVTLQLWNVYIGSGITFRCCGTSILTK
jgi:hypothetical protein